MTCPECEKEIYGERCTCGYKIQIIPMKHGLPVEREPAGITREQFGLSLYEAIKCCGGIMQLRKYQDMEKAQEDQAWRKDLEQREDALSQQLDTLLPKLSVADQEAMMLRYPEIVNQ
jgi:hypothetical protein